MTILHPGGAASYNEFVAIVLNVLIDLHFGKPVLISTSPCQNECLRLFHECFNPNCAEHVQRQYPE